MGHLARRAQEIPGPSAAFDAALARLRAEWDADAMLTRIDAVDAVVHSTARTDDRTVSDLASFDAQVEGVRAAVAAIGE